MRIRVCIPFYNEFETAKLGLQELQNYSGPHEFVIEPRQGVQIGRTRNSLINDLTSQERYQDPVSGFDAFLFVDSDIAFCVTDVIQLIDHNKPITAAPYLKHANQSIYECGKFDPKKPGKISERFIRDTTGFKKVDFIGAGFMLIWKETFKGLEYPWFRHIMIRDGSKQDETGEDVGFCMNANNTGLDIWCDFDIKLKHRKREQKSFNWSLDNVKE